MRGATELSEAVWGEMYLKVRRELMESGARLSSEAVDRIVEFRITQMAVKLVAMLDGAEGEGR